MIWSSSNPQWLIQEVGEARSIYAKFPKKMYKTKTRQIEILVTRSAKNFNLARKEVYKFIKRPALRLPKIKTRTWPACLCKDDDMLCSPLTRSRFTRINKIIYWLGLLAKESNNDIRVPCKQNHERREYYSEKFFHVSKRRKVYRQIVHITNQSGNDIKIKD